MSDSAEQTVVYTDGACRGNPGPGGWAWAVPGGAFAAGADGQTTNQRMELAAALEALRALPGRLLVMTDSTYVCNCFRDRWYEGWINRGWTNKARKPVANRDLWEPLIEAYLEREGAVVFDWVKGHSGDPMNDLVDRLAVEASHTQRPRSGEAPPDPDTLGEPDQPGVAWADRAAGSHTDGRIPAGHKVVVLGAAPAALGGFDANPVSDGVRRRLTELLAAKLDLEPSLVALTGLRLGTETLAAEAAIAAGVPFVAVLAHPDTERVWPPAAQRRFRELTASARETVTLERKIPADRQKAGAALARRDGWLTTAADEGILVWDGRDKALAKLHAKLDRAFGDDLWVLEPRS